MHSGVAGGHARRALFRGVRRPGAAQPRSICPRVRAPIFAPCSEVEDFGNTRSRGHSVARPGLAEFTRRTPATPSPSPGHEAQLPRPTGVTKPSASSRGAQTPDRLHGSSFHGRRGKSPNDPKLSDGRGWRDRCVAGERRRQEAAGVRADGYLSEAMDRVDSKDFRASAEDARCACGTQDAR